jgi:hypothetical protein
MQQRLQQYFDEESLISLRVEYSGFSSNLAATSVHDRLGAEPAILITVGVTVKLHST